MANKYIIKATGEREEFNSEKLRNSLDRAGAEDDQIEKIISKIESELKDNTTTKEIYHHAFELLASIESPAAGRYSLRQAIMDLGPTGFPFEQFVAEIFKLKGFKVKNNFIAEGKCAEHEIDIVIWNNEKLIMIETKFHNEPGVKSDLKVALYVKARWEDLADKNFDFDSQRKIDEGWLITNTKFSESAIKYAECQKMKIIGWNYPAKGNLQDLVEESKLHPITSLKSIKPSDKRRLIEAGVILCRQARENQDILKQCGLSNTEITEIMIEINSFHI
ncbi:MAG: restriction endonuclease [Candidatus Zambryskibacteria bacterium]|nr:restriction endonuclease [Candidatus Zambryskibacteria bacterium]